MRLPFILHLRMYIKIIKGNWKNGEQTEADNFATSLYNLLTIFIFAVIAQEYACRIEALRGALSYGWNGPQWCYHHATVCVCFLSMGSRNI